MDELVKKILRIPLTAADRADLAVQISNALDKEAEIADRKKVVTAEVSADLKEAEATKRRLNAIFKSGYQTQEVVCRVVYHEPLVNQKRYVDVETGNQIGDPERMSMEEIAAHKQLTFEGDPNDERRPRSRRQ